VKTFDVIFVTVINVGMIHGLIFLGSHFSVVDSLDLMAV
jgi:hypothetical protein